MTAGAVRGWHIALLYAMIWCSMVVASARLTAGADAWLREDLRSLVMQGLTATLVVLVTLVVPELRRAIPGLYERRAPGLDARDALVFAGLMLAWALGAHRVLVYFPLLKWDPSLFPTLGLREPLADLDSTSLLIGVAVSGTIAPFAEELVFRGYLLNLWMQRWGVVPGVLLSSAYFGILHGHGAIMAGVAGIFFALLYLRLRSLWPGTLLHALHNTVAGPLGVALFVHKSRADATTLSGWIPETLLAVAFIPLVILFWRRFRPTR